MFLGITRRQNTPKPDAKISGLEEVRKKQRSSGQEQTGGAETALGSGEKVPTLHDPDQATVHHALHCLTQATSEDDQSVTSCVPAISTRFQNRDDDSVFKGMRHQVLRPHAVV
jgi:hypothetical protein